MPVNTELIKRREVEIADWLLAEQAHQFANGRLEDNPNALLVIDHVVTTELPSSWRHFQIDHTNTPGHENSQAHLQPRLALLMGCAAAWEALFWSYTLEDNSIEQASAKTWASLTAHFAWLAENPARYPATSLVDATLAEVVHPAELIDGQDTKGLQTIFHNLASVALVHFASSDEIELPQPGMHSFAVTC